MVDNPEATLLKVRFRLRRHPAGNRKSDLRGINYSHISKYPFGPPKSVACVRDVLVEY